MDLEKLSQQIDQQRWLLNNGLITDGVKDNLFFYGSIVHPDVQAVEVKLEADKKLVEYTIYLPKETISKVERYNKLATSTSLFGMWRFKRFLKKEGTLNFQSMLGQFVRDFCGPTWTTKLTIVDFDAYMDNLKIEESSDSIGAIGEPDGSSRPADKLPD